VQVPKHPSSFGLPIPDQKSGSQILAHRPFKDHRLLSQIAYSAAPIRRRKILPKLSLELHLAVAESVQPRQDP
jgi:hypothetical protein